MAQRRGLDSSEDGVTVEGWFGEHMLIEDLKCDLVLKGIVGL